MTTKYFYFKRSRNPNALTYRTTLYQAQDTYESVYTSSRATMAILKSPHGEVDFADRYFKALKRRSNQVQNVNYWSRDDYVYYCDSGMRPDRWIDYYENCVLPNYDPKCWGTLTDTRDNSYRELKTVTVYEQLAQKLAEDQDSTTITQILLDRILQDYPSAHIQSLLTREYHGFKTNARICLTGTTIDHTINSIVKDLLEIHFRVGYSHTLSERLIERVDLENHEYFDLIADSVDYKCAPYLNTHRDIVVSSRIDN